MSLRRRVLSLLAVVLALYLVASWAIQQWIILPSFERIERTEAMTAIKRCLDTVDRELESMRTVCSDYAGWDDAAQFLADGNQKFIDDNLMPATYAALDVDLIGYFHLDGRARWFQARRPHPVDNEDAVLQVAEFPPAGLPPDSLYLRHDCPTACVTGLTQTSMGLLMVVSAPITNNRRELPIRGTLVMGRFLNADRMHALAELTSVPMTISPLGRHLPQGRSRHIVQQLSTTAGTALVMQPSQIEGYASLSGLDGEPVALMRTILPRQVTAQGRRAAMSAAIAAAIASVALIAALWLMLQMSIIAPLQNLAGHVANVGRSNDLSRQFHCHRNDEIGRLADEFNRMVQSVAESRTRLVEQAHQAGMSEIATEVLHNVGNALNTVGVTAEVLAERVRQAPPGLQQAVSLLNDHRQDLPAFLSAEGRGGKLVDYLAATSQMIDRCQADAVDQVDALQARIGEIKAIIATQQHYARRIVINQPESIARIVEDALRISKPDRIPGLQIVRRFQPVPDLPLERTRLLQVFANLVGNAMDAMKPLPDRQHVLSIRIEQQPAAIAVAFEDSGVGITPEQRERIFTHGYTTKPHGHGYGLHYSLNTMRQMGGRIEIASPGENRGSTFTVFIPLTIAAEARDRT